jgi:TonB family protein
MNRLQKKCFIVSAGTHLLLAFILLVGPAFLSSKDKLENSPILDFIPVKTVDALASGGGNPRASSPAVSPAVPVPPRHESNESRPPPTPVRREPEPSKLVERQESESLELKHDRKPRLPQVSTTLKSRHSATTEKQTAKSDNREREMADARRRALAALNHAASEMANDMSGSTTIELKGPGGGGVPYANFLQAVKSVYSRNWTVPDGASDGATISASVTIARDGTVVSSRITRRSGDAIADTSVEMLLERIRFAAPLPDGAKEDQRTVTIDFSVKAQRQIG